MSIGNKKSFIQKINEWIIKIIFSWIKIIFLSIWDQLNFANFVVAKFYKNSSEFANAHSDTF